MQTAEFQPTTDLERRMWNYMLRHPKFRYQDVVSAAEVSRNAVDNFAAKLRRLQLIKRVAREGKEQFFTVMDHEAADAFASKQRGRKEGVMWTAMRSLKTFTAPEILLAIGDARDDINEKAVCAYCALLLKADYLAVIQKARPGIQPARYRLINDSGPMPPYQRTLQVVVDGNEDRAVFAAGARL